MAEKLYALSEADRDKLRDKLDKLERLLVSPDSRDYEQPNLATAPDIYIAKAPSGGIPARSGDTAGAARCYFYRLKQSGGLVQLGLRSERVFNLSTGAIPANSYLIVKRDKLGNWLADVVGGGYTGDQTIVTAVSCNSGTLSVTTKVFSFSSGLLTSVT